MVMICKKAQEYFQDVYNVNAKDEATLMNPEDIIIFEGETERRKVEVD